MSLDQNQSDPTVATPAELAHSPRRPADEANSTDTLRFRRFAEQISDEYVFFAHAADGTITYVSPSIEKVLDLAVEAVIGLKWQNLFRNGSLANEDLSLTAPANDDHFPKYVAEARHADGSLRMIEVQQRPIFDSNGKLASIEGIAKDVTEAMRTADELQRLKQDLELLIADRTTELIRANEEVRRSEERYRTVVNCQTEFIVRWLPGAVYTFVNEAFCRLLEKPHDELLGWCFLHAMHPEDVPDFLAAIDALNSNQPVSDFENRLVLADGRVVWTQWTNQMLFNDDGEFLEYQSVGRDVTALKQAADIIREKETQLTRVSRLATIGELVAGIAHEVHQPLHAAKTFAEAARRNLEIATPEHIGTALDCTQEISNAISRTATIIRKLRDFTSLDTSPLETLDIGEIARDATGLLAYETRKNHVKLQIEIGQGTPAIQGDRIQLEKVCISLIMNAYEAMADVSEGERRLQISSESDDHNVRLIFCDNGCGVSTDDIAKLFDTFFSTKDSGLGMGLPLCKSIAEFHGGQILIHQNHSAGMTFVLELPRLQHRDHATAIHQP